MELSQDARDIHKENFGRLLDQLPDAAAVQLVIGIEQAADEAEDLDGECATEVAYTLRDYFARTIRLLEDDA